MATFSRIKEASKDMALDFERSLWVRKLLVLSDVLGGPAYTSPEMNQLEGKPYSEF